MTGTTNPAERFQPNPPDINHNRSGMCAKHGGYVGRCYRCPQTTATKTEHPADGSDRWSVTGDTGRVVYDLLGNHLALIDEHGNVLDSVQGRTLARVREYALMGDDDAVFAVLADLYRTQLAFGAVTR